MRRSPLQMSLTREETLELGRLIDRPTVRAGVARRAHIVLRFATGQTIADISREMQLQRMTVRKWLVRFSDHRVAGLMDRKSPGRPPRFSPLRGAPCGEAGLRTANVQGAGPLDLGLR